MTRVIDGASMLSEIPSSTLEALRRVPLQLVTPPVTHAPRRRTVLQSP